ncbi:hypothetical protein [Rubellimicrobium mesophilum]|nr:hypothetical protein [Rubellimicrobium mesophilum]
MAGSVLVGAIVFALFLCASFFSLGRDVAIANRHVAAAFAIGELVENPYQEGSTTIGSHQWNDCLITAMAIDQRGDRMRLAVSPLIAGVPGLSNDVDPCRLLKTMVSEPPPELDPELYHYDRYMHGATVLLRYLLPHHSIGEVRRLYRTAQTGVLVGGLALALVGIARGRRATEFAVLAVIFFAMLRFFGLESFSQSLGHGPADVVAATYALTVAVMIFAPVAPVIAILVAAAFGALTMVFELFTGGIPLGLAMVLGLVSLGTRSDGQPRDFLLSACAAAAFIGAAAVTYLLKIAFAVHLAGYGVIADIAGQLVYYSPASDLGPSVFAVSAAVLSSIGVLTGGTKLLSAAMVAGSVAAGAYGLGHVLLRVSNSRTRQRAILLAVSVVPIPAWFLAFSNQVAVHAWFMDRIIVWVIAAGGSLFVLAIASRYDASSAAEPSTPPARGTSGHRIG